MEPIKMPIPAYWMKCNNFGDALTPWLINKITGRDAVYTDTVTGDIKTIMVTGSILGTVQASHSLVWGNGYAYRNEYPFPIGKVYAVRGPITAKKIKDEQGIITAGADLDPGILCSNFYQPKVQKTRKFGIIPHVVEYKDYYYWLHLCGNNHHQMDIIDLNQPIEKVIEQVLSCEQILSSSLHGLILAHSYGIPARWINLTNRILGDDMKYYDYFESVGIFNHHKILLYDFDLFTPPTPELFKGCVLPDMDKLERKKEKLLENCPLNLFC